MQRLLLSWIRKIFCSDFKFFFKLLFSLLNTSIKPNTPSIDSSINFIHIHVIEIKNELNKKYSMFVQMSVLFISIFMLVHQNFTKKKLSNIQNFILFNRTKNYNSIPTIIFYYWNLVEWIDLHIVWFCSTFFCVPIASLAVGCKLQQNKIRIFLSVCLSVWLSVSLLLNCRIT